jgi:hypothetical protein
MNAKKLLKKIWKLGNLNKMESAGDMQDRLEDIRDLMKKHKDLFKKDKGEKPLVIKDISQLTEEHWDEIRVFCKKYDVPNRNIETLQDLKDFISDEGTMDCRGRYPKATADTEISTDKFYFSIHEKEELKDDYVWDGVVYIHKFNF